MPPTDPTLWVKKEGAWWWKGEISKHFRNLLKKEDSGQVMGDRAGAGPAGLQGALERLQVAASARSRGQAWDGAAKTDGHVSRAQMWGQPGSASPPSRPRLRHNQGQSPGPQGPGGCPAHPCSDMLNAQPLPSACPHQTPHTLNSRQETPQERPRQENIPASHTEGKQPTTSLAEV